MSDDRTESRLGHDEGLVACLGRDRVPVGDQRVVGENFSGSC